MKIIIAIATTIISILLINNYQRSKPDNIFAFWQGQAYVQDSEKIIAIRDLKPEKIQMVSGVVAALCDDELILRDDTSPILVNVDLEKENINLFQGEKVTIIGIYNQDELDALQLKRANGEVFTLSSSIEEDLSEL